MRDWWWRRAAVSMLVTGACIAFGVALAVLLLPKIIAPLFGVGFWLLGLLLSD